MFPQIRVILKGEGEQTFARLCEAYEDMESVRGILCRKAVDGKI